MAFRTFKKLTHKTLTNPRAAYPEPFIDDVTVNGGLNYLALRADPTSEVIVHCGPIPIALTGDKIELYWKGSDGIERMLATHPIVGEEIMVSLPISVADVLLAKEGLSTLYYTFVDAFGSAVPSNEMPCLIKTTVPGNPYSAPNLPDTFYINESMLAPTVVPLAIDQGNVGSGATVTIPAWAYMAEGDIPTLNWGGYPIKQPPLTAAQVGQPLVIKVSEADIRAAGNAAEVQVSYEIRDLANNWSLNSPATLVDVNTDLNLLDAPDVIDVDAGKLDFDALGGGISLTIVKTPAPIFSVNDRVTLYWKGTNAQGAAIEKSYELSVTSSTGRLQFKVPNADVALFIGGSVTSVSYTLASSASGKLEYSRSVMFAVTGTQLDLPAPQLENGLVDGVFEPVTLPSTGALISLPPYPGMAAGDRILLSWEGLDSKGDPLHGSDDQTLELADVDKEFVFVIDKNAYLNVGDGSQLTFSYLVIFGGTGATRNSDEVSYTIKNLTQADPPAPSVVEASGDILNPMNARTGATLRVKYDGMLDSDIIGINWNGDGNFPNQPGIQAVGYVDFPIDVARVAPTVGKTVDAFYSVGRNSGYDISLKLSLTVLDFQNPEVELPTPDVTELLVGVLDLTVFSGDAHVTVAAWPLINEGQLFWLQGEGILADGVTAYTIKLADGERVTKAESVAGVARTLARSELEKLAEGDTLDIYMKVAFDGGGDEGSAVTFPVLDTMTLKKGSPLSIDPTPVVLSAVLVRSEWPIPNPPAGTFLNRQASGGVPPYRYAAQNPMIVEINTQGTIISKNNGSTTITVIDQKGASVSYMVTVSGVLNLFGTGIKSFYPNVAAQAASMGGRVPSVAEWLNFIVASNYGGAVDVAWAADVSGSNRYVVNTSTGALGTAPGGTVGYAYSGYGVR